MEVREEKRETKMTMGQLLSVFWETLYINNIVINKIYNRRGLCESRVIVNNKFYEWGFVVTFQCSGQVVIENENFNPRDGILGASMGLSKDFAHWCLSK